MKKKKREPLSQARLVANEKKSSLGSNEASDFEELLRQLEDKELNEKEDCDSLRDAALAGIEILGKSEETIEKDPEVLAYLRHLEIKAWEKELKEKGIKGSYFASEDLLLEEKMPLAVLNGRRYPYIPVIEVIRLDAQSKGFKAKFFTQKGGIVYRLPDLDAAVRLLSEADGFSNLKDAAQEKDAPAYLKKALSYCDRYAEFWANESSNRKKKYGTPSSILAKIHNIETEDKERSTLNNEKTAFYRFLRPFYFYEDENTWPWVTHVQTADGDIAPIPASPLVHFDQSGSSLIRAIYPLKKAGGVYRFLLFPGYRKNGCDEKLPVTVPEKKYVIKRNGNLVVADGKEARVRFDENSPESNWGFEKEIKAKLPDFYKTLVPFRNSNRIRMLTYKEALENGLQGVEALFKGSSSGGLLPSMGGQKYTFVRDDYLYFFRALSKDSDSKKTSASPDVACWDEKMAETERTSAELPAHNVASLKFNLRQVGLIEVKEEDIHDFFSFYFKALKKEGGLK